jgi:mRNA interferase MazF
MTAEGEIKRGSIYVLDIEPGANPQQEGRGKKRPVLVVQNDWGNAYADTTIVVPLSSGMPSRSYPFHVELPAEILGKPGIIMCEQIWTVSVRRIDPQSLGECPSWLMDQVDEALRHSLGLSAETGQRYLS